MRKLTLTAFVVAAVATLAQTATAPVPIDWRYALSWTDPNAAGQVASWTIYATNQTTVRSMATSAAGLNGTSLQPLLNGAPAGIYTLYTTPISQLGAEGDPGDTIQVSWPGGNGKLRGGTLPRVGK